MLSAMALATYYVVANRNLAPAVLAGAADRQPQASLAGIDPTRLANLFVILARYRRPYGGPARCKLLTDATLDQCVLLVPPRMVALLATAEPFVQQVAAEWASAPRGALGHCSPQAAAEALVTLIELAKTARRMDTDLLLWLSLARNP